MTHILVEITSDVPGTEAVVTRALQSIGENFLPLLQAGEGERVTIDATADDDGVKRSIYVDDMTA